MKLSGIFGTTGATRHTTGDNFEVVRAGLAFRRSKARQTEAYAAFHKAMTLWEALTETEKAAVIETTDLAETLRMTAREIQGSRRVG